MAVTIKDIAAAAGLSHVTVSKVLRGTGNISEATRRRVTEIADRMRYRPNAIARSMRDGRTGIVGMIYSSEGTSRSIGAPQLIGIQSALAAGGYELMLGLIPRAVLAEPGNTPALLRHWTADGLLINHHIGLPAKVAELVEEDHVPAVWMNSKQSRNCVYFDDAGGAREAVQYLLGLGHRQIAYVDLSHSVDQLRGEEHYSIADRHDGYVEAMRAAGQTPVVWIPETPLPATRRTQFLVDRYRASTVVPTAIIAYGHATELMFLAAREGLVVPRDLSVISFAGEPAWLNDRAVTLAFLPYERLGAAAAEMVLERIRGVDSPARALPIVVQPADTTAPPHAR